MCVCVRACVNFQSLRHILSHIYIHLSSAPLLRLREKKTIEYGPYFLPRRLPVGPCRPGFMPIKLLMLIALMEKAYIKPKVPYDAVDMFAGEMAISKAYKAAMFHAAALDTSLDKRDEPLMHLSLGMFQSSLGRHFFGCATNH